MVPATTTAPDPKKEALWRERLARQAASGLSICDWCRQAGYSDSLFHYWKSTLAKRDGVYSAPRRRTPAPAKSAPTSAPAFAQVVLAAPPPAPSARAALELVLAAGRLVRVYDGFDPATLARLLAVLEGRGC
jgi:hypothetical protein